MVCDEKYLRQVSQYLKTSVGKISFDKNGNISAVVDSKRSITGFATIILYLAKSSKIHQLGKDEEDEVEVRQWVEYITCYGGSLQTSLGHKVLDELNNVLSLRAFFLGNYQTLADVVIYYGLYNVMLGMSLQEKEQYQNISRWFAYIQQDPALRQKNRLLTFSRIPLYS